MDRTADVLTPGKRISGTYLQMSTPRHGISANVPETVGADIISVAADAKAIGISSVEIEKETGSVFDPP